MTYVRITPSAYPRVEKCLSSAVIPAAVETMPGMSRGTAIHAFLQRIGEGAHPDEALGFVPAEWREDCADIPLEKLPDLTSGTSELALAWSPGTGACRILGAGLSREEAAALVTGDEVPMLADWAARTSEASGILLDWKSGWREQLAPAAEHLQLLTYGAVYLVACDLETVELYLCRPDRERPHWDGPVCLDRLDAEAHLARIRALLAAVDVARAEWESRGVLPVQQVGPWCEWCPARRRCPAQVASLLAVLEGDAERAVAHVTELTPEQAGSLWATLKTAEKVAVRLRKELESFTAQGPIPLPGGDNLAAVPVVRDTPIPAAAVPWLRIRYGDAVASAAVETKMTWTHLEEVLSSTVLEQRKADFRAGRWQGAKPTKKALLKEVRQGLAAAGAVTFEHAIEVKPVKPPPMLAAPQGAAIAQLPDET